jgi:putative transposase
VKYRFMIEHRNDYAIALMCRVLRVARAGFYAWLRESVCDHAKEDERLLILIRASYLASRGVYGARRVFGDLREAGESCGLHRVEHLMRKHKIKAIRGYKSPRAIAGRPSIIAPNHLQRAFTVDAPNTVWVTDITYIRTWQGWLYLAVVVNLFARRIVGWSMSASLSRRTRSGRNAHGRVAQKTWQAGRRALGPGQVNTAVTTSVASVSPITLSRA